MSSGESELEEETGRLTDMAPEVVCMLVAWVGTPDTLHLRATCRTLNRAMYEVAPWMLRRLNVCTDAGSITRRLSATDVGAMERTMLYAPWYVRWGAYYAAQTAAWMGDVDVLKYLHENGHRWNVWACWNATRNGHRDAMEYMHAGERATWPCVGRVCEWAGQMK